MRTLLIEQLTWPEIRDALADGYKRVLVPVGAMEQHGPHLPVATDSLLGYALSVRAAETMGKTLVAPGVTMGLSRGHMALPGTVTLSESTLAAVLMDVCQSLAEHGFAQIVLVPSHGGNYRPIREVLPKLKAEVKKAEVLAPTPDLDQWVAKHQEMQRKLGLEPKRVGFHAGQGETSMMLATYPDMVDMSKAEPGFMGDTSIRWQAKEPPPISEMSPNGILGDAVGATAEIGEQLIKAWVEELIEVVEQGQS